VRVGRLWLIAVSRWRVLVRFVPDLIWVYGQRTNYRKRINNVILSSSYAVIMWDRRARKATIKLEQRVADEVMAELQAKAPWLNIGYSDTLKEAWNNDRAELIALTDNRRELYLLEGSRKL